MKVNYKVVARLLKGPKADVIDDLIAGSSKVRLWSDNAAYGPRRNYSTAKAVLEKFTLRPEALKLRWSGRDRMAGTIDGMQFNFSMLPGEDLIFTLPGEGLEWAIRLIPERGQEEEMPDFDFDIDFLVEGGRLVCVV